MRRLLLSLALAGIAVSAVGVSGASAATIRMVDGDGKASPGNCDSSAAAFKTVQAAVTAASAGDTVLVCPGTYTEKVVIGAAKDRLTVRSVGHLAATIKAPASLDGRDSIIFIKHGADRVTIKDLAVRFPTRALGTAGNGPCGALGAIRVDAALARIESNNIAATGPSTATCGIAYGIFVGYGPEGGSARIRYNIVKDTMISGIVVGDEGNRMTAFRNKVIYHHVGQQVINAAAGTAASGRWRTTVKRSPSGIGPGGSGITIFLGSSGTIRENTVEGSLPGFGPLSDNPGASLIQGIQVDGTGAATVSANRVYRSFVNISVGSGVRTAQAAASVIVSDNLALSGYAGIGVDAEGALIDGNQTSGNVVGIAAEGGSSGNTFTDNRSYANLDIDCVDLTSADVNTLLNTWTGNTGNSDSPAGICVEPK